MNHLLRTLAKALKPPRTYSRKLRMAHYAAIIPPLITMPLPLVYKVIGIFCFQLPAFFIIYRHIQHHPNAPMDNPTEDGTP